MSVDLLEDLVSVITDFLSVGEAWLAGILAALLSFFAAIGFS